MAMKKQKVQPHIGNPVLSFMNDLAAPKGGTDHRFDNSAFGTLDVLEYNGDLFYIGTQAAALLGYKHPGNALDAHVDIEDKLKISLADFRRIFGVNLNSSIQGIQNVGVSKMPNSRSKHGGARFVTIISEVGFYFLAGQSKLPRAKQFMRWVFGDVLPSIRKTGSYGVNQQQPNALKPRQWRGKQWYTMADCLAMLPNVTRGQLRHYIDSHCANETIVLRGEALAQFRFDHHDVCSPKELKLITVAGFGKVQAFYNRLPLDAAEVEDKARALMEQAATVMATAADVVKALRTG